MTTAYTMSDLSFDEYGEVTNSQGTFIGIANDLNVHGSVVIGWTDGDGTHFDILFVAFPEQHGDLQGGLRGSTDLFVSIMRKGAFGFLSDRTGTHPSYVAEKLGLSEYRASSTVEKLTDLINGVRHAILEAQVPA